MPYVIWLSLYAEMFQTNPVKNSPSTEQWARLLLGLNVALEVRHTIVLDLNPSFEVKQNQTNVCLSL